MSVLIAAPAGYYAETHTVAGGRVVCRIQWPQWPAQDMDLQEPFLAFQEPPSQRVTAPLSTVLPLSAKVRSRTPTRGRRSTATAGAAVARIPMPAWALEGGAGAGADDVQLLLCESKKIIESGVGVGKGDAALTAANREWIEVGYNLSLLLLNYFVPLAVLLFTYTRVGFVLWKSRVQQPDECHAAIDLEEAHIKAKRKVCCSSTEGAAEAVHADHVLNRS